MIRIKFSIIKHNTVAIEFGITSLVPLAEGPGYEARNNMVL